MSLMLREPFMTEPFRLLNSYFSPSSAGGNGKLTGWWPTLDVHETEGEYVVVVDLPGVKPEDVSIELEQQVLTVSGARAPVAAGETKHLERPYGSFVRTLTLPRGVEPDEISADYRDGVLEVHVPKPAAVMPKKIPIGTAPAKVIEA